MTNASTRGGLHHNQGEPTDIAHRDLKKDVEPKSNIEKTQKLKTIGTSKEERQQSTRVIRGKILHHQRETPTTTSTDQEFNKENTGELQRDLHRNREEYANPTSTGLKDSKVDTQRPRRADGTRARQQRRIEVTKERGLHRKGEESATNLSTVLASNGKYPENLWTDLHRKRERRTQVGKNTGVARERNLQRTGEKAVTTTPKDPKNNKKNTETPKGELHHKREWCLHRQRKETANAEGINRRSSGKTPKD